MMKSALKTVGALLLLAAAAYPQAFPAKLNPKLTVTAVPNSNYPVMGLGFLSDGRMLVLGAAVSTSPGNGAMGQGYITPADTNQALYVVSGLSRTGALSNVTFTKILDSLTGPPPGVVVVNDTVYVQDRTAFYRVKSLSPTGGTAKSKNAVRIINAPTLDSTFVWLRGPSGHQYVFTPVYHDGRFYAPYSGAIRTGGHSNAPPTSTYSGAMLSWSKDSIIPEGAPANSGFTRAAGGIRSPNGMASNGEYMVFTDNQGSFTPANPLRLFKPGQPVVTYGTRQSTAANAGGASLDAPVNTLRNWAEDLPYQPPLIWVPYDNGPLKSVSQPVYLPHGPYQGDWLVGDVNIAGMGRLHIEQVGTNHQGSFHMFAGSLVNGGKAINRLALAPDSGLYFGSVLNIGNWPSGAPGPITRLDLKDTAVFEILAVRSRKSVSGDTNGVEVFFSQPIDPATVSAASFTLQQLNYQMGAAYGCNSTTCTTKNPVVTGVTVSNDKRKVFVGIATPDTSIGAAHFGTIGVGNNPKGVWGGAGQQDRTLKVTVGAALRSATGSELFHSIAWLGWHFQSTVAFNPANTDLTPTGIANRAPDVSRLAARVSLRSLDGILNIRVDAPGQSIVSVYSMKGARVAEQAGATGDFRFDTRSFGRGMHVVRVRNGSTVYSKAFLP